MKEEEPQFWSEKEDWINNVIFCRFPFEKKYKSISISLWNIEHLISQDIFNEKYSRMNT